MHRVVQQDGGVQAKLNTISSYQLLGGAEEVQASVLTGFLGHIPTPRLRRPLRTGLPRGGVDPINRHLQRNLKGDLPRTRGQQNISLDPLYDLAGIAKLGEEPLHHGFDLGQHGLPLTSRLHAILERLRIPDASSVVARTG
jgi:hypothetical protein